MCNINSVNNGNNKFVYAAARMEQKAFVNWFRFVVGFFFYCSDDDLWSIFHNYLRLLSACEEVKLRVDSDHV